jgi:uncharacterized membrane protein YczE
MLSNCDPAIISLAICISLIFLDVFRYQYNLIPVHIFLGFFSLILLTLMCSKNAYFLAWFILLLPFIILGTGVYMKQRSTLTIREGVSTSL